MNKVTPPRATTTMGAELTTYLEALMALTREPEGAAQPVRPGRRRAKGLSLAARVELAELPAVVRESRAFRLINRPDPRLAWLLRYAVGCALAHVCDPAIPPDFPLSAATRALGDQLGTPITLVCGLEPMLAGGPLARSEEGGLMLLPGLDVWLVGRDLPDPDLIRLGGRASFPAVDAAADRVATMLDPARPVVLCGANLAVAAAFAARISAGRGRALQTWATRGDVVPPPALCCAAEAMGEDLLLALKPRRRVSFPFSGSEFSLEFTAGQGLLFLVLDAEGAPGHPLLELGPMVDVIDLGPLCEAMAAAGTAQDGGAVAAPTGEGPGHDRVQALLNALYPDAPVGVVTRAAVPTAEDGDDEGAACLAAEHWQQPTRTLDALVLPDSIRAALDAIVRSAEPGKRAVVLFHGPPGTGKSEAGHCLAGSMGRPLYRLQGGVMRGRFYGEFERRLLAVFAAAQARNAVILIDEADEWVGRREGSPAQVGGAHILESSQVLQALDRYQGVAVLTTNRSETLDPALSRRVDAWIHLPLPAMEERMALWVLALGDAPLLRPVDLMLLAAIPLSGGEIVACVREVTVTGGGVTTLALLAAARRRSERRALMGD